MDEQLKGPSTMKKITMPEKKSLHVLHASASGKFSVTPSPEAPVVMTATPTKAAAPAASHAQSKQLLASPRAAAAPSCLCSPTTHAGSFRCRLHRGGGGGGGGGGLAGSVGCGLNEMGKKPSV